MNDHHWDPRSQHVAEISEEWIILNSTLWNWINSPLTCDWTFPIPPENFVRKFQGNTMTTPHVLFLAQTVLKNALILPVIITKDIQGWFHQSQESNLVRSFIKKDFQRNVINFRETSKPNSLPGFRRRTIKCRPLSEN